MTNANGAYRPPPEGWQTFGFHAPMDSVPRLEFSDERDDDLMPLWERHLYNDAWACALCKSATDNAPSQPEADRVDP